MVGLSALPRVRYCVGRYLFRRTRVRHPAPVTPAWPLVGRAEELELVAAALVGGDAGGLLIAGAGGVGKTRLAQAGLAAARAGGRHTEWTTASAALGSIPFGAMAYLLADPQPLSL